MRINYLIVALALTAPLPAAWAVSPDPDSLPKVACSEFKFSKAFLDRYPRAPAACQEGRVYNGQKFAKFTAKVFLNSKDRTTLQFMNVSGDPLDTFSIKPRAGSTITVNGNTKKWSDLKPGDPVTLWVPESRLTVSTYPGATAESWTVLPPLKQ